MKKALIVILLLVSIDAWSDHIWLYNRQWSGQTLYHGSGRALFDNTIDLMWSSGIYRLIERPSNDQLNLIRYGLRQYNVRTNDVYRIFLLNEIGGQMYLAIAFITSMSSDGSYRFSYQLFEDLSF